MMISAVILWVDAEAAPDGRRWRMQPMSKAANILVAKVGAGNGMTAGALGMTMTTIITTRTRGGTG
jgi:hypothetical protein